MDHEDTFGQYFQNNAQYYRNMENRNMPQQLNVAGCGADGVSDVGGKYEEHHHEEHDAGDDNEWKYVKEVQQSEKQQSLKVFGSDDLAEKANVASSPRLFGNSDDSGGVVDAGNKFAFGNGNANGISVDAYERQELNEEEEDVMMGNGVSSSLGVYDEKRFVSDVDGDVEIFKNDGDFSTTSNVTDSVEDNVPQVDVKIEANLHDYSQQQDLAEEEEPSTTNGTSSLSENPPQPLTEQLNIYDTMSALEDKENADPLAKSLPVCDHALPLQTLTFEQNASQLNPDAKEFVPNFGSNPASPTSPLAGTDQMIFGLHSLGTMATHQLMDDDFVAESPRKTVNVNMDAIPLPTELAEFEQEAAQRPHELEENDNEINDENMSDQEGQQLPFDQAQKISIPFNLGDHGPETSVDLEINTDSTALDDVNEISQQIDNDVMKRSVYVAKLDDIKDILNTVQPLPIDNESANTSFIEENATESANVGDKELLQVEEKEHVSHSPSTEEMHINMTTGEEVAIEEKAIDAAPNVADINNSDTLQESICMENENLKELSGLKPELVMNPHISSENPLISNEDPMNETVDESILSISSNELTDELQFNQNIITSEDNLIVQELISPLSTEEKHLVEETKESQAIIDAKDDMTALEQQMDAMILTSSNDGHFSEEKEVETLKTTAIDVEYHPQMDVELVEQHFEEKLLSFQNEPLDEFGEEYDQQDVVNIIESSYNETDLQTMTSSTPKESEAAQVMSNLENQLICEKEEDIEMARMSPAYDLTDKISNFSNENLLDEPLVLESDKYEILTTNNCENDDEPVKISGENIKILETRTAEESVLEGEFLQNQMHIMQVEELTVPEKSEEASIKSVETTTPFAAPEELDEEFSIRRIESGPLIADFEEEAIEAVDTTPQLDATEKLEEDSIKPSETNALLATPEKLEEVSIKSKETNALLAAPEKLEEVPIKPTETTAVSATPEKLEEEISTKAIGTIPLLAAPEKLEEVSIKSIETNALLAAPEKLEEASVELIETNALLAAPEKLEEEISIKSIETTPLLAAPEKLEEASVKSVEAAALLATAPIAAAAVVAATKKVPANKTQEIKKSSTKGATTAPAKLKVGSTMITKKPDAVKQPITASKTASAVTAKPKPASAARKPAAGLTTNEAKLTTKTTASAATAAARPLSKTTSATTARKVPGVATSVGGLKLRPASAPSKPTTLGLSTTKTKPPSPRSTLTTQIRKTTSATVPSTAGKSTVVKSSAPTSSAGGNLKTTTTVITSRTKSSATSSSCPTTKTFTARPAPKFNNTVATTTTTTSTKRNALTSTTVGTGSNATVKTSTAAAPRKPSPAKPTSQATNKTPPTRVSGAFGGVGQKTKTAPNKLAPNKTASSTAPKPIRKPQETIKANDNEAIQIQEKQLINGADEKYTLPNGDVKELTTAAQSVMDSGDGLNFTSKSAPVDA